MLRINLRKTDSTSAFIKRHSRFLPDMTFVSAGFQTAGRGRGDRTWESKPGENLLFSFLCKKPAVCENYAYLSCGAALAVVDVLSAGGFLEGLEIKWPNDVYCNGRKLCGILLEGITEGGKLTGVICGIGINVNQTVFPENLRHSPTSVWLESGGAFSMPELKRKIYASLADRVKKINAGDLSFMSRVQELDFLKGRLVEAEIGGCEKKVKVIGINKDCSLAVNCEGKILNLISGEVSIRVN